MDTSEEYIKMCEKAVEIQPELSPFHQLESKADLFYDYGNVWYHYVVDDLNPLKWKTKKVLLYRQDQLQEMVGLGNSKALTYHFYWYVQNNNKGLYDSMEQLWLAYVMHEKYNKVWDGDSWQLKGGCDEHNARKC